MAEPPWTPGSATGVGSLPGDDIAEAVRFVLGELPDLPHLPELPARGPGADLIGRGAAHLAGLHVDLQPAGWRLAARPGMDERRARDLLARDLDALEQHAEGYTGPLKVQVAGPWTLAASVELPRGNPALADGGAVRDLVGSLAEGLAGHVADLSRRLPGARLFVQLDEPALPAVLRGEVPTVSGFDRLPSVPDPVAEDALRTLVARIRDLGAVPLVHCCAADPPVALARLAGAAAVSVDAARLTDHDDEALGEAVEAGLGLFLGLVPALGPGAPPRIREVVDPARRLWARLGFPPERLPETVVVTPAVWPARPRGGRAPRPSSPDGPPAPSPSLPGRCDGDPGGGRRCAGRRPETPRRARPRDRRTRLPLLRPRPADRERRGVRRARA